MVGAAGPLVALVHVGMGSFLAMQAFYGATFTEGVGAVVGVGLIRNAAPLLAGLVLAVVLAGGTVPELRFRGELDEEGGPRPVPDRGPPRREPSGTASATTVPVSVTFHPLGTGVGLIAPVTPPARLAAARIVAAALAGPVLALVGACVGTLVGWRVAGAVLGVSTETFFLRMFEMLWVKDVVGVGIKGVMYGAVGALFACVEGLRGEALTVARPGDLAEVRAASIRAARWSFMVILLLNSSWFLVLYLGGSPFAPSVQ
jgi:phospholipid/cholesterol/gamma-HCH transport system permease protein